MHAALHAFLAQTAEAQSTGPQNAIDRLGPLPIMVAIFGIFYFLMIRPQQKHARQLERFVASIKKGDEVATQSGIIGTVYAVEDKLVVLDVGGGVKLRVLKNLIAGAWRDGAVTSDAPKTEAK